MVCPCLAEQGELYVALDQETKKPYEITETKLLYDHTLQTCMLKEIEGLILVANHLLLQPLSKILPARVPELSQLSLLVQ